MIRVTPSRRSSIYVIVDTTAKIARQLNGHFALTEPGAFYSEAYKKKQWDGKRRFFNLKNGKLMAGLLPRLHEWAHKNKVPIEIDPELDFSTPFDEEDFQEFIATLDLPFAPRDYQHELVIEGIKTQRRVFVSATGSGKSFAIYLLARFWHHHLDSSVIIIVPTVALVKQLMSDFKEYGVDDMVQGLHGGLTDEITKPILVSTWQSLHHRDEAYFKRFSVLIADECHQWQAKRLEVLAKKCHHAKYRYGLTGTLREKMIENMIIESVLGPRTTVRRSHELIADKHLSPLSITCIELAYPVENCADVCLADYHYEMKFLRDCDWRNQFIASVVTHHQDNSLVLFNYIEHGERLYEAIKDRAGGRPVYLVYGKVKASIREEIRLAVQEADGAIIVASYGTFSTGINIPRLFNVFLASPTKAKIRLLQSIGRGLRLADDKLELKVFDFADDLRYSPRVNVTWKHYEKRKSIYKREKYPYVTKSITVPIQQVIDTDCNADLGG